MNTKYELLNLMLKDLQKQNDLYKPTSFWQRSSKRIIEELTTNDISEFRKIQTSLNYFVPLLALPGYRLQTIKYDSLMNELKNLTSINKSYLKLENLISGEAEAHGNFRVIKASNIDKKPYLDEVSESSIGNPIEQFTFQERKFSRSFLNYLMLLSFLKKHINSEEISRVFEIGGGFGTLGEILLTEPRNAKMFYINADIPPVAFVSSYYLSTLLGDENVGTYDVLKDEKVLDIEKLEEKYKAINLCSWQVENLQGKIDLFVNSISFQEMEPNVVANYCKHVQRLNPKYILLRNIKEGKKSSGIACKVEEPILGEDYDTFLPNYKLIATDGEVFGQKMEDNFHSELRLYIKK